MWDFGSSNLLVLEGIHLKDDSHMFEPILGY